MTHIGMQQSKGKNRGYGRKHGIEEGGEVGGESRNLLFLKLCVLPKLFHKKEDYFGWPLSN